MPTAPTTKYRPDIDGLRAIAVMVIVAFHGWPAVVRGGYVGVDVFFVISGFLITRILAEAQEAGRVSFARFYLRRARRILPAYLVVTLVTALAAAVVLLPEQLANFGATLAASGLFITNLYFTLDNGYFLPAAHDHLLLHLWSLAVEEQFYLLWPLVFVLLSRCGARVRMAGICILAVGSLALAQWWIASNQSSLSFFLLPTRAWELLLGAALALGLFRRPTRKASGEVAAWSGLALIAGATFGFSDITPFPGVAALIPCAGAALVIWGGLGPTTTTAAILGWRPLVAVGLVSYSLYLWHWPLLTLPRLLLQRPLGDLETVLMIALAVALACLSWRFIERPWREQGGPGPRKVLAVAVGASLAIVGTGVALFAAKGLPGRLPPAALAYLDAVEDMNPRQDDCFVPRGEAARPDLARCTTGKGPPSAAGEYDVLLWGDSHSDAYAPGVAAWAEAQGLRVRQLHKGACPPLLDAQVRNWRGDDPTCPDFNRWVMTEIRRHPEVRLIVVAARWPVYLDARPRYHMTPVASRMQDLRTGQRIVDLEPVFTRTLDAIHASAPQAEVLVIGPHPDLPFVLPECLAQAKRFEGLGLRCHGVMSDVPLARLAPSEAQMRRAIAGRPFVRAIFPAAQTCGQGWCEAVRGDMLLYFDHNHISATAARALLPKWLSSMETSQTQSSQGKPAGSISPLIEAPR